MFPFARIAVFPTPWRIALKLEGNVEPGAVMARQQSGVQALADVAASRVQHKLRKASEREVSIQSAIASTGVAFLINDADDSWCDIYPLHEHPRVTIGRSGHNQIVVPDERCSRLHCKIVWRADAWYICDVGSRNGTFINGERLHSYRRLEPGDRIRISSHTLVFTTDISESTNSVQEPWEDPTVILDHVAGHVPSLSGMNQH